MLVFIIPIKSQTVSNSWSTVSLLFERTLKSVCQQTSQEFKVIVVCHEKPIINFSHKNVEYLFADFLPPKTTENPSKDIQKKCFDHKMKLWLGSVYAESLDPTHVMFVDADDCVSCRLAKYVQENIYENGWYVDKGFEYPNNKKIVYPRSKLYQKSGSSNIIRYDLLKPILVNKPNKEDMDVDKNFLNHKLIRGYFDSINTPMKPLPFRGSVYVTEHGDNIFLQYFIEKEKNYLDLIRFYGGKTRKFFMARPLTEDIRSEFCL
ncbi:MAG: glycosyltransferase family A protein [Thainema sp.]